ncbi:ABC transporter permease [Nocardia seriolae]|uniref:ABC transporter permease n=1 Tax=Nocardia seriolae TaxID=37332 RepID=UPI00051A752F|nr:FtsX-like permease family protein [Nocardia seriolae]RLP30687.1 ABC transporter permease [Nocardia seriolae]BEK85873.1 FtsX-like permease family protein [Nocardia seriolae]
MVSRVLLRKLLRDLWRQRWQFLAIATVLGIGVAAFVAATDAYRNLDQSFARAYSEQRLPDAIISGPGAAQLSSTLDRLPGQPIVDVRHQSEVGIRVHGRAFLGRAIGVPESVQPGVSQLEMKSGTLPSAGRLVVEQHLADHYGLKPGDSIELLTSLGWQAIPVAGSALSAEYFWPARSVQEIMTTPEHFGVVFVPDGDLVAKLPDPVEQVALYARDRAAVGDLTQAAEQTAREHGLQLVPRDQQPSYRALQDDVNAFGTFANLLPWLFLAAAVLGTYVLLSRVVAAQRAVIGTLVANGFFPARLRRHYLGYGLACAVLGIVPGLAGGYLLGDWITTRYTRALGLPLHVTALHPLTLLIAAAATLAAATLAAWAPARAAARMRPAEAMRVAPPAQSGGRSLVERLVPPLKHAPARWRMTVRAVLRNRRRAVFTVAGVAVAVSLVMVFAGLRDTVATLIDRQYGRITLQDAEIAITPGSTDTVLTRVRQDPDVAAAEPVGRYDVMLSAGQRHYDTLLISLPPTTQMHRFTATSGSNQLSGKGVLLGSGLRETLGLSVGDSVDVSASATGHHVSAPIAGFVDEPLSPVVYVSSDYLRQAIGPVPDTGVLVKLRPDVTDEQGVSGRLTAIPGAVAYLSTATLASAMRQAFAMYNTLVGIMLVFAAVMAAALLFNAISANIGERLGELGALRAAGMGSGMLSRLIAAENLTLAVVGIPVGVGCGILLARWLMSTYDNQGAHLELAMRAFTPALVAVAILAAAIVVQLPALRRVRALDIARIVRERSL